MIRFDGLAIGLPQTRKRKRNETWMRKESHESSLSFERRRRKMGLMNDLWALVGRSDAHVWSRSPSMFLSLHLINRSKSFSLPSISALCSWKLWWRDSRMNSSSLRGGVLLNNRHQAVIILCVSRENHPPLAERRRQWFIISLNHRISSHPDLFKNWAHIQKARENRAIMNAI